MPAALRTTVAGLLKPRGHQFKVTPKGSIRRRWIVQWQSMGSFGLLLGLTILGMLYSSFADFTPERQPAGSTAIVLFWSVYNVVVLLLTMAVCVEFPRYRSEERIATSEPVEISAGASSFLTELSDISITGARIRGPLPGSPGDLISVRLQDIGETAAQIVRQTTDGFAVEFTEGNAIRDALIRRIY
jgi:cellulose synthase (UDP-forming)